MKVKCALWSVCYSGVKAAWLVFVATMTSDGCPSRWSFTAPTFHSCRSFIPESITGPVAGVCVCACACGCARACVFCSFGLNLHVAASATSMCTFFCIQQEHFSNTRSTFFKCKFNISYTFLTFSNT